MCLRMRSIVSALMSNKERFWRTKNVFGFCECKRFKDESVLGWVLVKKSLSLASIWVWMHKVVLAQIQTVVTYLI